MQLCLADAIHNLKWLKIIQIWKKWRSITSAYMYFEIFLMNVMVYHYHVQKLC